MYNALRELILDSVSSEPQETMWAKLPSYYVGESFVRFIPFKDHINIEAIIVHCLFLQTSHIIDLLRVVWNCVLEKWVRSWA